MHPLRLFSRKQRARPRRRIRKLRLLALLTVLLIVGSVSFSFGLDPRRRRRDRRRQARSAAPAGQPGERLHLRQGRQADPRRPARVRGADADQLRPDRRPDAARDRRDRGSALLGARRDRPARHRPRPRRRHPPARPSSRAARRSRSSSSRTRSTATRRRSRARCARPPTPGSSSATRRLVEEEDPAGVPEHDLLRQRRLRDPAGRAHLLPARRQGPDAGRVGAARRDPGRPDPLRPGHEPRRGREAAARRPAGDARGVEDHAGAVRAARTRPTCPIRTRCACPAPRARRSTSSTTSSSS